VSIRDWLVGCGVAAAAIAVAALVAQISFVGGLAIIAIAIGAIGSWWGTRFAHGFGVAISKQRALWAFAILSVITFLVFVLRSRGQS
jgi:hypothetical protein